MIPASTFSALVEPPNLVENKAMEPLRGAHILVSEGWWANALTLLSSGLLFPTGAETMVNSHS